MKKQQRKFLADCGLEIICYYEPSQECYFSMSKRQHWVHWFGTGIRFNSMEEAIDYILQLTNSKYKEIEI